MLNVVSLASSSSGNAYLLIDDDNNLQPLLLDCGLPFDRLKKEVWARGLSMSDLAGCLLSHEHGDHSKSAGKLAGAGIDVYTSWGTIKVLGLIGHYRARPVKAGMTCYVDGWAVKAFATVHDCEEPLGFFIAGAGERLVYATDTAYLTVKFKGLNVIMIECNYALNILEANESLDPVVKKRTIGNHFSLDQVKKMLQANDLSQVREIHLLHLSDGNSDADRFKREIQELSGLPTYISEK